MTTISVKLAMPNKLRDQARKSGLLSNKFLRGAIETELIRRQAAGRLLKTSRELTAAHLEPMSLRRYERCVGPGCSSSPRRPCSR